MNNFNYANAYNSKRIPQLDFIKFIAIFFVVLFHLNTANLSVVVGYTFWGFSLANFSWASGILAGIQYATNKIIDFKSLARHILKLFTRLILPALVLIHLNMIIENHYYIFDWSEFSRYYYVAAIFGIFVVNDIILMLTRGKKLVYMTAMFMLSIIFTFTLFKISGNYDLNKYFLFNFRESMLFFPFFTFGSFCGIYNQKFTEITSRKITFLSCLLLIFIMAFASDYILSGTHSIGTLLREVIMFACIVVTTSFVFTFFPSIYTHIQSVTKHILNLGTHSLAIYLLHWYLLAPTKDLISTLCDNSQIIVFALNCAAAFAIIEICSATAILLSFAKRYIHKTFKL